MKIRFLISALTIVLVLISSSANAQVDYSKMKVDQLTDAQIKEMMKRGQDMGYSEADLEQRAAAGGMSATEIQKLKARVEQIRQQGSAPQNNKDITDEIEPGRRTVDSTDSNYRKRPDSLQTRPKSRIFGSELFSSGKLTFEPNMRMATPKNYVIGPDDELLVDLTGNNEASYRTKVSPEGYISLQYVGRIAVGGLTIEAATDKIRSLMSRTYPALRSGGTQLAINIGNIKSIRVTINGEVTKPGTYTLPSLATVFNALYASGGPNENGSFRNIQVIRNNNVIATVDVYDFLINGIQTGNITLQDQDVIHVPVYLLRVDVLGEVKRSAIYEMKPDESLLDVMKYAGGFSSMAYKAKVRIFQNTATERKIITKSILEFPDYKPKNGDKVFVDPILDRFENKIQIVGAVFRPGMYELTQGLTLKNLIKNADGLKEDAFMERGYIIRLNEDNTTSVLPFSVSQIMQGAAADIPLKREDIVQISSIFDLRDEYTVSIGGEVRTPGTFNYSSNMSVEDLIQMAGGFKEGGSPMNIEVSRRVKGADMTQQQVATAKVFTINVNSNLDIKNSPFILQPFDIVAVRATEGYTAQQQVRLAGEVLRPGIYTIQSKNERISDVIKRAGGLTAYAYAPGASLKRPQSAESKNKSKEDLDKEARLKALNLNRLKQRGSKDSSSVDSLMNVNTFSDLVGIQLDRILKKPHSDYDLILQGEDVITVPSLLQTVKVTGEVLRPISIIYNPGKPMKYYVRKAGGFTKTAYKSGSFVSYANGSVQGARKGLFANAYPKIKPGAEIAVPKKSEKERMSAQGWVGLGSAIASLAAIIVILFK
ncbi:capsule polysaccharide transporter [Niabella soli DSM 19437]|uniref:Capsule polysaccharide transporter n=1 Tax=Niabella soli DSM 19437 TaxID=929713 RepID=W0ETZ2_9BACT|nr:capsule polysaccharide transporter [Niabella soli DSM 19437]